MFVRIILPRERTVTDTDDNPPPLSRRRFLKIMGVTAAGVGIAACKVSPRLAIIRRQAAHKSTHARPARILKRTTHRASAASRPAKPGPAPKPPALANAPVYRGPLSDIELQSLAAVSLPCIALTPEAALAAANRIGIQHPSNMCGPLSAFLLRETGVIAPADPRQFWLLNPRLEYTARMLRRAFPPEQFYKGTFRVPIDQFDFNAFPLYAGDFLFVYAGSKGTFDHVLTVNRVDDEGRAYAISNLNIGKGPNGKDQFIVDEVMLYDPNNPGVGQFYEWTNRRKNFMIGLTGYGGFDLWRRWDTKPIPAAASPEKTQMMLGAVLDQGGQWAAKIKRLGGDVIFSRNADAVSHPASIIKLAVGMLLLAMIESRAKDVQAELRHTFDGGRSYETLLKRCWSTRKKPPPIN